MNEIILTIKPVFGDTNNNSSTPVNTYKVVDNNNIEIYRGTLQQCRDYMCPGETVFTTNTGNVNIKYQ